MGHHDLTSPLGPIDAFQDVLDIDQSLDLAADISDCQIWIPNADLGAVGRVLIDTDIDCRTAGAILLAPGNPFRYPWNQRHVEYDRPYWAPIFSPFPYEVAPISPDEGHVEMVRGERGQSFVADVVFGGVLQQMVVNFPATVTIMGDLIRRVPFRVTWRRRGSKTRTVVSADRAGRPQQSLDDRPLAKRTTYRYSPKSQLREIVVEEFQQV